MQKLQANDNLLIIAVCGTTQNYQANIYSSSSVTFLRTTEEARYNHSFTKTRLDVDSLQIYKIFCKLPITNNWKKLVFKFNLYDSINSNYYIFIGIKKESESFMRKYIHIHKITNAPITRELSIYKNYASENFNTDTEYIDLCMKDSTVQLINEIKEGDTVYLFYINDKLSTTFFVNCVEIHRYE